MNKFHKIVILFVLACSLLTSVKAQVGSITTTSTTCKLTIESCEGDTLTLTPQDQATYANYKWYYGSVAPANEINAGNAAASNLDATNFAANFPTIKVVDNGGTYILTAEYASPSGCATKNDTFELNFTPRPVANNAILAQCEKIGGSGMADFLLTDADATVTGSASGVAVTYHATLADARNDANALSSPHTSNASILYVRVENTTTGCYRTSTLTLNVNTKPSIADAATTICNGTTLDLTTQILGYGLLANPVWTLTTVTGTPVTTPTAVSPTTTTTYILVEENGSGCRDTAQVLVNVNYPPVIADVAISICENATLDLTAEITNYNSYVNPVWSLTVAGGTVVPMPTAVTPSTTTTYILIAEIGTSCNDTAHVVVTVNSNPDFTLSKPVACPGTTEEVNIINLTNAIEATALLKIDAGSFVAYPSPATILSLSVGNHTFTVRNTDGCETEKSIAINSIPANICLPVVVTRSN
jgi:hypothetical protein